MLYKLHVLHVIAHKVIIQFDVTILRILTLRGIKLFWSQVF